MGTGMSFIGRQNQEEGLRQKPRTVRKCPLFWHGVAPGTSGDLRSMRYGRKGCDGHLAFPRLLPLALDRYLLVRKCKAVTRLQLLTVRYERYSSKQLDSRINHHLTHRSEVSILASLFSSLDIIIIKKLCVILLS
jgi:hypothetical protein